ncbi:MAG TPA: hypothetical protein VEU96_29190 [Bryobacteraceae bacterium]|nr:hypothetical protein [Bryobacteraceae bacterium]
MFLRITTVLLAIAAFAAADTLTLRNGQVVRGEYVGGDARHIKMAVGDRVETYNVDEVSDLQFGGGQRLPESNQYPDRRDERRDDAQLPPPPPPPPPSSAGLQIPSGTLLTVRMIDAVDSEKTRLGETFRASVDEPVLVDGQTVIPRGADAIAKLVEDRQSGKITGKTVLTLSLMQVMVNGRMVDVSTGDVSQASSSRGARSGKVIGGTAAAGAIIGAIAGGGRGAAIGAGSGAAVGTGVQVFTKGQRVRIPSETRLTFTLQQPAQI